MPHFAANLGAFRESVGSDVHLAKNTEQYKWLSQLAVFVLIVAILRLGQEVLLPLAFASLLAFLLSPLVMRLTRWHVPKALAIIVAVSLAFSVIGGIGWIVTTQAGNLIVELPNYEQNLHRKISTLRKSNDPGVLSRMATMLDNLGRDLEEPVPVSPSASVPGVAAVRKPVPVEVQAVRRSTIEWAREIVMPLIRPLGVAVIVVALVVAMLFQREDLRDRFIKMVSAGELNVATEAVDDASRRVSRYLGMQLVVNAAYGLPIGLGLYLIGIPHALLWGLLSTLLRFIPFIGPWIAAMFPLALAIAVDPGWSMLCYTLGLIVVVEIITNNFVEIALYGASTGISNLALLVAAVFWTWLWGPAGLALSTPLTVCLLVLGKHVPGLKLLSMILGNDPVLEPPAQLYQRMLSMDSDEMLGLATKLIEERSLAGFYDEVFIPALVMSEEDRHNGTLAEVRQKFIFDSSRDLIEELERRGHADDEGPAEARDLPSVLVVPAHDDADEVAALMLWHLLRDRGVPAAICAASTPPAEWFATIERDHIKTVFISAVPPAALITARQTCRRLKERCPQVRVIVGVWSRAAKADELKSRLRQPVPDGVVTRLVDALPLAEISARTVMVPAPIPANETARMEEVRRLDGLAGEPDELFDAVTRELAQAFQVPIALVTIVDADRQHWRSQVGLPPELADAGGAPRDTSICGHLVALNDLLIVEDIAKDRRFAGNPLLRERGIRFYAGAPLRTRAGQVLGSLCVIDTKPRQVTDVERKLLVRRAAELMESVEEAEAESETATTPS